MIHFKLIALWNSVASGFLSCAAYVFIAIIGLVIFKNLYFTR